MQITIVAIGEVETKKNVKGTAYSTFELTYKSDGQTRSKKFMSFDKPAYPELKQAQAGEVYDIGLVKDGEFWKWTTVEKAGSGSSGAADAPKAQGGGVTPTKGTWETHEERALKQLYISRSVALAQAVATHAANSPKTPFSGSDVLSTANMYEQWLLIPVHGTPPSMEPDLDETDGVM